jgi:GTP-binding protein
MGEPRAKSGKKTPKTRDFTVAPRPAANAALDLSKAAFSRSVHDPRDLPTPSAPELAFVGRSNAGKSSAINALANRRRLAFVSKTPGRTQLINFFSAGPGAFLVDLPGYGYAGVPGEVRRHWEILVGKYIAERESLALVVIVMDVRHPLTPLDLRLVDWLKAAGRRVHVLLTKADKLSKQHARRTLDATRRELQEVYRGASVQLFSSSSREGVEEALEAFSGALRDFRAQKTRAPAKGE